MLADIVDRVLREELVGERADRREWLWHRLWELDRTDEFPIWLIGLVDVALWDLEGRVLGVPVHRLLGTYREEIPACASTTTFATIEEFLEVADQCLELGYPAIKLHAWGDARADADLCQRLRDHVGPDIDLMYDGSAGFDLPDAIYLGRALSEANYRWYEEPIREFSITAYKWLSERVDIPLLVGETSDGSHLNTADFIASGCATYVRTSANHRGGMTGAMRIAHLADAFRLRAEVHGPTETAVHLCMAIPNCTYYESLVTSNPATREARCRGGRSRPGADGARHRLAAFRRRASCDISFIVSGCATYVRTSANHRGGYDRRDADRPSGRLVPAARRGARPDRDRRPSLHGDPELHVLRVTCDVEPCRPRTARRAGRPGPGARRSQASPCRLSSPSIVRPASADHDPTYTKEEEE